jgi:phenylacetate-CoA ligase
MHISAEDIVVEIVDASGKQLPPGASGEIVITHLATGDFPFIRYRTGDIGTLDAQPCRCGRGLPLLKDVQGRTTDFVVALDGTIMHALALIYVVRDLPGIRRYKIVQESRTLTRVLVVPGPEFSNVVREQIVTGLTARLGEGVTIDVETVTEIAAESSGKFRYVVSHVRSDAAVSQAA